mgnify:FL=1
MKLFITFLSFYFLISLAKAEIVQDIKINGNKKISDETIKIYGGVKIGQDYIDKDLDRIIKNLYGTNFFEDINVNLSNNTLTINLKEFPSINQLIVIGEKNSRITKEIKKLIFLKEKQPFIRSKLSDDIELIKRLYSSLGYNSPEINTKIKEFDDTLDLLIEIVPGQQTKISSINFIGDKKISNKRLRDVIASEENKFWKFLSNNTKFSEELVSLDERLLKNYYKSIGYYDVNIISKSATINKNKNIDITYSIDAGNRYIINKISTNINPVIEQNIFNPLQKTYNKYIGNYYSPFTIKKILDEIDEIIDENNIQFIEHNVEEVLEDNTIEIIFNIYETKKIFVNRIDILGNTVTNEEVIRNKLLLVEGDPYSELALKKTVSEIRATNLFNNVTYDILDESTSNKKDIAIRVEEKPTGEVSAGAGVGTSGGSFAIIVSENNWLGKGDKIQFELDLDSESLGGVFNYSDNDYNYTGNKLNYYISSQSNDKPNQGYENTIISSGIKTSFEQFKDIYLNLGIEASYDDLRTQNSASSSLKKQSGEFSEIAGIYGFRSDNRNRAFMPTSGYITNFEQKFPIYADKQALTNTFSVSNYKQLSENMIGASKIFASSINGFGGDDVRLNERRGLSSNRLRGFERGKIGPLDGSDHVGGNYAAALNFEANFPNLLPDSTRTEIGTFLDFGNVWGVDYDDTINESNEIRSSAGVAMSWSSPIGPMSFVLSKDIKKADTDKTQSFTFNLGTTF